MKKHKFGRALRGYELSVGLICEKDGKPVIIVGGQYEGTHGISNYWHYRHIRPDGTQGRKYGCYGGEGFTETFDKYKVLILKATK